MIEYSVLVGLIAGSGITIIIGVGAWVTGKWQVLWNVIGPLT